MAEMELLEDLFIRCNKCGKKHRINKDWLEYSVEFIDERGMGAEFEHTFVGEEQCDECDNRMSFRVMGYEYPEGAYNNQQKESKGCSFISEPVVDIVYRYDFDYPYDVEDDLYDIVSNVERNIDKIVNDPNRVYELSASEFEELVAEVFRKKDFDVIITPKTRDGGKDIIASYNMNGLPCMLIIECKKYARGRKVGVRIVRELYGIQQKEHYGKAVIVTSSSFSKDARRFADDLRDMMILVDFKQLMEMLDDTMSR